MRVNDASREKRRVAVGTTREEAAAAFGQDHDQLLLTTFAELADEVDLDQLISLDLAAGEGLYAALDNVGPGLGRHPGFSLRIVYTVGTAAPLIEALQRNHLVIADVQRRGERLILVLEGGATSLDSQTRTILSAIDAATLARTVAAEDLETASGGAEAVAVTGPAPGTARPKRPRPPLLGHLQTVKRWRNSRRRLGAIAALLAGLALVLLLLGLLSGTSAPVVVVLLVALVLGVAGSAGVLLVAVLLLARQVHAQTGRLERMVLRNRGVVQRRTTNIDVRLGEIANLQRRLPFMFDYLEAMAAFNSASAAQITDQIHLLGADAGALHLDTQRQVQALLNLHRMVEIGRRVPPMGAGAAAADFDVLVVQELLDRRPQTVVAYGDGTTTLALALAVKQYKLPTRIVFLEHLESAKSQTEQTLRQHGVAEFAEVRLAPLSAMPDHGGPWYGQDAWSDLDQIGLLVMSRPPGTAGDEVPLPTLSLLVGRLAAGCTIIIADLIDPADLEVAQSWSPLLADFEFEQLDTLQKHAGVFRR